MNAIMADKFNDLSKEELVALLKIQNKLITDKDKLIESLKEQLNLFRYDKFNSKTEKNISDEDRAFDEAKTPDNEQEIEEADEDISVKAHTRKKSGSENKKKGRKPLPDNLPRQEILYDINDKDKICSCGIPL